MIQRTVTTSYFADDEVSSLDHNNEISRSRPAAGVSPDNTMYNMQKDGAIANNRASGIGSPRQAFVTSTSVEQ